MHLIFYILIVVALFVFEILYFRVADKFDIIDKPNERSSHTHITLRGGGVVFYFGIFLFTILQGWLYPAFFLGLSLISTVSFLDDIRPLSSRLRLPLHFMAMGIMFIDLGLYALPWYFWVIALVIAVGIINAFNFMDGINGITGAYSMVALLALWYVNQYIISFADQSLIYIGFLSVLVFNFFNFRTKASCFAGDVGSVSIAFILVFLLGKLIVVSGDPRYLLFLAVYGVDTILTIIHRIILKEDILKAHRKHAYQLMANELKIPHLVVSLCYSGLQLILSALVIFAPFYSLLFVILLAIVYVAFKFRYFSLHTS